MTVAQQALHDGVITTLILLSPVLVYILVHTVKYWLRRKKPRKEGSG